MRNLGYYCDNFGEGLLGCFRIFIGYILEKDFCLK